VSAAPPLAEREYEGTTFPTLEAAGIDRSGVAFYDCTFEGCDLSEARLTDCRFIDCVFEGCDLGLIQLTDSSFRGCRFEDCHLVGVVWGALRNDPGLPPEIDFVRCALDYGEFSGLDLTGRTLRECRLHEATFAGTLMVEVDLRGSDAAGASFDRCDLRRADLRNVENLLLDPCSNRMTGAKVSLPGALSLLAGFEVELS
jgi:uncharacterized protein YjbI with pentapeptide repeats